MKSIIAIDITAGTNTCAILSANASIGAFLLDWADCTNSIIRESVVSDPTRVAFIQIIDDKFTVAVITSASTPLVTGIDSPVNIDSSKDVIPRNIFPRSNIKKVNILIIYLLQRTI